MENDEDSIIRTDQSPEDIADEESAFAAAFAEGRGEEPPTQDEAASDEAAPATAEVEPVPEAQAQAPAAPSLIAGLTEEQIGAALTRAGNLQSTVDKMAGRMGQLMQQLEALKKTPPTTQKAQQALDVKLEKLTVAFPELAAILKEDLAALGGIGAAPVAEQPPPGLTQEQLDAILGERFGANNTATKEMIETRVLSVIHPDWNQVIREPEFVLFRDNVLPAGVGKELMESEDASFIASKLTEYKTWRANKSAPAPVVAPVVSRRLSNAVLPAGTRTAPTGPVSEEDAFLAAFKRERAHHGA